MYRLILCPMTVMSDLDMWQGQSDATTACGEVCTPCWSDFLSIQCHSRFHWTDILMALCSLVIPLRTSLSTVRRARFLRPCRHNISRLYRHRSLVVIGEQELCSLSVTSNDRMTQSSVRVLWHHNCRITCDLLTLAIDAVSMGPTDDK